MPAEDGSQYILAKLFKPIEGPEGEITHVIVGGRIVGRPLTAGIGGTPTNIAYVKDKSLLDDERLDFKKVEFAAIGFGSCIPAAVVRSTFSRSKKYYIWKLLFTIVILIVAIFALIIFR